MRVKWIAYDGSEYVITASSAEDAMSQIAKLRESLGLEFVKTAAEIHNPSNIPDIEYFENSNIKTTYQSTTELFGNGKNTQLLN